MTYEYFPEITNDCMNTEFMWKLIALREKFDKPMNITSSYRKGGKGNHDGHAVDVNIWGWDALKLISLAMAMGFTGIGTHQKGPFTKRFVHLDDRPGNDMKPRPWFWTYGKYP